MKGLFSGLMSALFGLFCPTATTFAAEKAQDVKVAMMSGSQRGWLPSRQDFEQALAALDSFTGPIDDGNFRGAYGMLTAISREAIPIAGFIQLHDSQSKELGPVEQRRIVQMTWGKDPPAAPAPGVYVAIDVVAQFEKAERYCGYVILYRSRVAVRYEIMREESAFISDEKQHSRAALDRLWLQMASSCPNYSPAAGAKQP